MINTSSPSFLKPEFPFLWFWDEGSWEREKLIHSGILLDKINGAKA